MSRVGRRLDRLRLVAAQDRAELVPLVALGLLVLLTSFLLAAVPRQLAATRDEALREALSRADPAELELSATTTNTAPAGQLDAVDEQLRDGLGPLLTPRVTTPVRTSQSNLVDTFTLDGEHLRPRPFSWLVLTRQPGLLDGVRWVQGSAPHAGAPTTARTATGRVPLLRVGMLASVAADLDLRVGRTFVVRPLTPQQGSVGDVAVQLSGTFERTDPDDPRWGYLTQVWSKGERYTPDGALLAELGAAVVDDSQAEQLRRAVGTLRHEWHYPVDPATITPGSTTEVLAAVRRSVATASNVEIPLDHESYVLPTVTMGSGLVDLLVGHLSSSRTTSALVAVVVAGLSVVGLLVLALAALVVVVRRSPALDLARARGASVAQVVGVVTVGVGVLVVPAAAAGALLARALVGRDTGVRDLLPAAGVALWTVAACGAAAWTSARTSRRMPALRAVLEGALVVLAVAAVLVLRARGTSESAGGTDLLLAAAPVLVALAVAVVLMRVLPPLVARLAEARRGSRGLVSFLGLARAARQPAVLAAPLAALLVALCFAVFATGAVRTVDAAQVNGTWRDVGADYQVQATFFSPEVVRAVRDLDGVDAVAAAYVRSDGGVLDARGRTEPAVSLVVDTEAYADVLARAPGRVADREVVRSLARDTGRPDDPLPVLATAAARQEIDPGRPRADLGGGLGVRELSVRGDAGRFPLDDGGPLVVADLAAVQARESAPVRPNTLLVAGAPGLAERLDAIAARTQKPHHVDDRREALEVVQDSPFVGSTRDLFALVVPAALLYAVLATLLALVLAAPTRRRDAAVLRRLGASMREAVRLDLTEQAPSVLGMLLGGAAAGLGLVALALGAVDLAPLTGGVGPPDLELPLTATGLLTAGLLVVVAATAALVSVAERHRPGRPQQEER